MRYFDIVSSLQNEIFSHCCLTAQLDNRWLLAQWDVLTLLASSIKGQPARFWHNGTTAGPVGQWDILTSPIPSTIGQLLAPCTMGEPMALDIMGYFDIGGSWHNGIFWHWWLSSQWEQYWLPTKWDNHYLPTQWDISTSLAPRTMGYFWHRWLSIQ